MTQTRLTTDKMMTVSLFSDKFNQLKDMVADLSLRVALFEALVWFPRLQAVVNASKSRGMRGELKGITVTTWCCAGRCLIQLQRGEHRLTLITADDEKPWQRDTAHVAPKMGPMGIQAVEADHVEAMKMLYVMTRWGDQFALCDDDSVTVG